jgi:hypothetical protein
MRIKTDEKGFITEYTLVGNLADSIEAAVPKDIEHFRVHYEAYACRNGELVFDSSRDDEVTDKTVKEELRIRRERECFSFVNRGQLWYGTLTVKQIAELTAWYKAWLKVTETKVVPDKPSWLE